MIFDLLHLDGASLLDRTYDQRRSALERSRDRGAELGGDPVVHRRQPAPRSSRVAVDAGMEGVVAKRRFSSLYRPGQRSHEWIKVKHQRMQEVVIGGYTKGQGNPNRAHFGALLLGLPSEGTFAKLTFVGKVGTGFQPVRP